MFQELILGSHQSYVCVGHCESQKGARNKETPLKVAQACVLAAKEYKGTSRTSPYGPQHPSLAGRQLTRDAGTKHGKQ